MASNNLVVEMVFDPVLGVPAKKKVRKDSEELGEKAGKEFKEGFKKSSAGIGNVFRKNLQGAAKSAFKLASALTAIGGTLLFRRAVIESKELERALLSVNKVAGSYGISNQQVNKAVQELASDGLIPLRDVTESLRNLIGNFDGDLGKAVSTFKSLRDAAAVARQGQLSLGEAVRGASEGLKNDLSIKVDNAGITKNLSVFQREYAASIGTTVGKLTEAQKTQAEFVGIQREALRFGGAYNDVLKTFDGAVTALKTSFRFLLAGFGALVTKSPAVIALINGITKEFRRLFGFFSGQQNDFFKSFIINSLEVGKAINKWLIRPLARMGTVLDLVSGGWKMFKGIVLNAVSKIAQGIIKILPDRFISDRLREAAAGFADDSNNNLAQGLLQINNALKEFSDPTIADNIDAALGRLVTAVSAAKPEISSLSQEIQKLLNGMGGVDKKAKQLAATVNTAIGQAVTKVASQGIQALTKSLLLGEKGFENFGKKIAGILGSMAIQLGETLIFTGLGIEALKSLGGAAAIAAGVGLIALGTILKSFSGDGAGADAASTGGADTVASAITEASGVDELAEPEEPDTKVSITVQGDIFDSAETGLRISQILEEASLNENVKVTGFAS